MMNIKRLEIIWMKSAIETHSKKFTTLHTSLQATWPIASDDYYERTKKNSLESSTALLKVNLKLLMPI
jgi:hypothetical protein